MNKLKIGIVGTNGLPMKYGGWEQLVHHLTIYLEKRFDFIVYTPIDNADKKVHYINNAKIKYINLRANGIQSIFYDAISMLNACFLCDIILILGSSGCIFLPFVKIISLFSKVKIIFNPDGLEWKRKKWSGVVKKFLKLSERIGITMADIVISDNKIIYNYLVDIYGVESKLIEYGGDHVKHINITANEEEKYGITKYKYAFKVCRIEPENNVDMVLDAFRETHQRLVIVGNWNYSEYGKKLKAIYKECKNILLLEPIYEQEKLDSLRGNCSLYIHGHSAGGTNPSLVEAMSLGLCCVVYDVNFNVETTKNSAIYFKSKEELVSIITDYKNSKIDTSFYKRKMYEIAKNRYTWKEISGKYADVFLYEQTL